MVASLLSLSRFVLALLIFYEILHQENYRLASILILLAALTDFLDGFVARKFERETPIGAHLDHVSDKFFVLLVLTALLFKGRVEAIQLFLIAFREIGITLLRFYGLAGAVNRWGKLKTVTEFAALFLLCLFPFGGYLLLWVAVILAYLSAFFYLKKPAKVGL